MKCEIKTLADLKWWIDDYSSELRKRDKSTPLLKVLIDAEPKPQYGRRLLVSGGFHITRTCCLSGQPDPSRHSPFGVRVFNHVFSSRPTTVDLTTSLSDEPAKDLDTAYRKGYYGEGRANWDASPTPLAPQEETALTRRQAEQKHVVPQGADIKYTRVPDDEDLKAELDKKVTRLQKRRLRTKHKQQLLPNKRAQYNQANECPSSDSSSSASDSDA